MPLIKTYQDPRPYAKNNITYYFFLKSNRGTDVKHEVHLPPEYKRNDIMVELEDWCSQFAAWEQSVCRYGYKKKRNRNK